MRRRPLSSLPHRRTRRLAAAALALCLASAAGAQTAPLPDWSSFTGTGSDSAVAADAAGNSLALTSPAGGAITLTRRSTTGQLIWQRSLATLGTPARGTSVLLDANGGSLVTGALVDAVGTPQAALVARLDSAGNLLWQDVLPGAFSQALRGGIDAAGLAYVLSHLPRPGTSFTDLVLAQYGAAGQRQWSRTTGARYSGSGSALLVSPAGVSTLTGTSDTPGQQLLSAYDAAGNLIAARQIASSDALGLAAGRTGEVVAVGAGGLGFLVVKHDAALNELWRTSHAAAGGAQRVAVDAAGNLLVSGVTNAQTGQLTVISNDWLTLKLDPTGALLWRHQLGTLSNRDDAPTALALGSDGAAYLTGSGWYRPAGATDSLSDQRSIVTLKLGSDGAQRWLANTPAALQGAALALGADGGVLVLGDSTSFLGTAPTHVLMRYPQTGLPNQAPLALASASPASGSAPLNVVFSPAGSSDTDGLITSWRWDFGDGQSAITTSGSPISHSYAAAGSYSARLTVLDSLGAAGVSAPVVVNVAAAAPPKPTAITLAATSVVGGQTVRATVRLSTAAGATVALSSSNRTVASVPASLVVPAGASQGEVVISTAKVRKNTAVTIRATANGASASTTLTVRVR